MRIEQIESFEELLTREAAWRELFARCPSASPFQSPDWLIPWIEHVWAGGRLWILAAWRDDAPEARLAGLLPLFLWGSSPCTASFLGAGVTDYLDVLVEPGDHESLDALIGHLYAYSHLYNRVELVDVPLSSPLRNLLPTERGAPCFVVELPDSFEAYRSRLSSKFLTNLRNAHHRLEAAGHRLCFALSGSFDELVRLHTAQWQARGEPGVLDSPGLRSFHRAVARRMAAADMLRLYSLFFGDRLVAVFYGFARKARLYAYLTGADPEASRFSPAALLLEQVFQAAIAEGIREFDMLRDAEPFKQKWMPVERPNAILRLCNLSSCRDIP